MRAPPARGFGRIRRDKLDGSPFQGELQPVWKYANGSSLGYALSPVYKTAPLAAAKDPILYELLVLVDVFRIGRQREKSIAIRLLKERLA